MAGLDPAIQRKSRTTIWMRGSSPRMRVFCDYRNKFLNGFNGY
jgi:hypothetical protein